MKFSRPWKELVLEELDSFRELYHGYRMLQASRDMDKSLSVTLPNGFVIHLKKFLGYKNEPLIEIRINGLLHSHFSDKSPFKALADLLWHSKIPLFSHFFQHEVIHQLGNTLNVCTIHTGLGRPHAFVLGVEATKTLAMALRGAIQGAESYV